MLTTVIDNGYIDVGSGLANRIGAALVFDAVVADHRRVRLRQTVSVAEGLELPKRCSRPPCQIRRDRGAAEPNVGEAGKVEVGEFGNVKDSGHQRRHSDKGGHAVVFNHLHGEHRIERLWREENHLVTEDERYHHRGVAAGDMEQWNRQQGNVLTPYFPWRPTGSGAENPASDREIDEVLEVGDDTPVVDHRPLWPARPCRRCRTAIDHHPL